MTKEEVISYFKTQKGVADVIGIKQSSVSGWPAGQLPVRIADRIRGAGQSDGRGMRINKRNEEIVGDYEMYSDR